MAGKNASGGGGKIGPGDVQWMTAGSGIVHEEFHSGDFTRQGGTLQMVQLWVNLQAKDASSDSKLLVMGGEPIAEPLVGHGPFVMNSPEEIQQAFEDYQLGRMGDLA